MIETSETVVTEDRSLRDLVGQLSRDGATLIQQEIALAKAELAETADKLKQGVVSAATGALVLYAGILTLIAAAVLLLALAVPGWLSALLVGGVVTAVGAVLVGKGKKDLDRVRVVPKRALDSVERDVDMLKEAVR
jgi:hypothetical protein